MLPFLKSRRIASLIIAKRKPDAGIEMEKSEGESDPALMSAAEDLISAVHAKDAEAVCSALQAAFQVMDSMPESESNLDGDA